MTKLYNRKTQEMQTLDSTDGAFIEMAVKLWVKVHNDRHPGNRISRKDILIIY